MAHLLHLSDLHLGPPDTQQSLGDYKGEIVPVESRNSRIGAIERALEGIAKHLEDHHQKLDAAVISGDVTLRGQESGYRALGELLDKLGDARPPNDRIMIVPGNHDVRWFTPSASPERYEYFLEYVRRPGFVTPFLDGIDAAKVTEKSSPSRLRKHAIVADDYSWYLVPMSSADYCGQMETAGVAPDRWEEWASLLEQQGQDSARAALDDVRLRDMPRISPWQFKIVRRLIRELDKDARRNGVGSPCRIVTLHHHLLPVSDFEEVKPTESFANLGALRHFLRDLGVHVVLHGHKHTGLVYRDSPVRNGGNQITPEILVISGGTVGLGAPTEEPARLLELATKSPAAPTLTVHGVKPQGYVEGAVERGRTYLLWPGAPDLGPDAGKPLVVAGESVNETYDRAQTLFEHSAAQQLHNLVAIVHDGSDSSKPPRAYPEVKDVADKEVWYSELIKWWQLGTNEIPDGFTHGTRIRLHSGRIDQMRRAIDVLSRDRTDATRAILTLIDPSVDMIDEPGRLPAFCMLQFVLRLQHGKRVLDAVGFFRNQEMRYWWPINVAEIYTLLEEAQEKINEPARPVSIGNITTFCSIAHSSTSPSFVATPPLDRQLDLNREKLWNLTAALALNSVPRRNQLLEEWDLILESMIPGATDQPARAAIPLRGINYITKHLERFHSLTSSATTAKFLELFETLSSVNNEHWSAIKKANAKTPKGYGDDNGDQDIKIKHGHWIDRVSDLVARIRSVLGRIKNS